MLMGKSATGKDTVGAELLRRLPENTCMVRGAQSTAAQSTAAPVSLREIVEYTTRPMREKEQDGVDYYFVSEERLQELKASGKVIECRCYQTIHGPWYYFNVDDGQFDLEKGNRLLITTLEGYAQIRDYFGKEKVVPLYLEISDRTRLHRAVEREDKQSSPKYAELCRRFLADNEDFSEKRLQELEIAERYSNENLEECLTALEERIRRG